MTTFSAQQGAALQAIRAWLDDESAGQVFYLAGFAGVGKTTIAKEVRGMVDGTVRFAAYTGKAASVLNAKGCRGATTLHSLVYTLADEDHRGQPRFELNAKSPLHTTDLLVVDEVSMVGPELGRDLLSFGMRVLVIGDPFQLPPVSGAGFFTSRTPDFTLTEIHRQAEDSPIIRMSMDIREGRGLTRGQYGESRVASRAEVSADELLSGAQIIVGTNASRNAFNRHARKHFHNATGPLPLDGDRIICLRNDSTKGLLNGVMGHVRGEARLQLGDIVRFGAGMDDGVQLSNLRTPLALFQGEKPDPQVMRRGYDAFDYAYAVTAHKAQGSQWDHVVVLDESRVFREESARWLYTAVTRAAHAVTVLI